MDEQLLMLVSDRLDADASLDDDAGLLVLAACEGDDSLIGVISGESQPTRPAATRRARRSATEPPGAYLRSISVEGFRGVGEPCALELTPGPGLTLVVGRNGSGKSSFVEALEVLLTDESRRWSNREKAWGEGWRNLHHPSPVHIDAEFAVDGVAATTTITKEWSANAALADAQSTAQVHGKRRTPPASLGWDDADWIDRVEAVRDAVLLA